MVQTEYLKADEPGFMRAAALLRSGLCVAFPTETVYGLGADASNATAVARIYEAKERPSFNPLIAHFKSTEAAFQQGIFNDDATKLASAFWPGPLTLIVPMAADGVVCDLARAGLNSVGLRVPSHPAAIDILRRAGTPIVAPSANRSGRISATSAMHVQEDLSGRISAILDGGETNVGVESTIIDCTGPAPRLLRPGGIPNSEIEAVLGKPLGHKPPPSITPLSPGMLTSHYAPEADVRLNAVSIAPGEAALLFGEQRMFGLDKALASENLSLLGNLNEAASRLFSSLRRLDNSGAKTIAVAPIPRDGLGEAINDRLERAAAERG